uniref:thiol oxidase n=1 Tax=viral metagenome TaxID=1070528 RepID=A0A6C0I5N6_9ZZZZ
MQYVNFRNTTTTIPIMTPPPQKMLMFSKPLVRSGLPPPQPIKTVEPVAPDSSLSPKKMKWGQPTWYIIHTLAEKVKEEAFVSIRTELLRQIYNICTNLPCPICSTHATEYLNGVNFSTIVSKDQLKMMLFQFHNEVNKRKGVEELPLDECNAKYVTAVTENMFQYFLISTKERQYNVQLISNNAYRERVVKYFREWLTKNSGSFAP